MRHQLDERQIYLRGTTFRNIYVILIAYLIIDAFLQSNGIKLVEGIWGNITIVVLTSAYGIIDMILREIVDLEERSNRFLFGILGVLGIFLFVMGIIEGVILKQWSFFNGSSFSEEGVRFLFGIAWMLVGIAWLYKVRSIKTLQGKL